MRRRCTNRNDFSDESVLGWQLAGYVHARREVDRSSPDEALKLFELCIGNDVSSGLS